MSRTCNQICTIQTGKAGVESRKHDFPNRFPGAVLLSRIIWWMDSTYWRWSLSVTAYQRLNNIFFLFQPRLIFAISRLRWQLEQSASNRCTELAKIKIVAKLEPFSLLNESFLKAPINRKEAPKWSSWALHGQNTINTLLMFKKKRPFTRGWKES